MNENERRKRLKQKLAYHFKAERKAMLTGTAEDRLSDAHNILWADRWASKRQRAWKPEAEVARLENITRALNRIVSDLSELPEYLRFVFSFDSARIDAAPKGIMPALIEIKKAAQPGIESAKKEAARGRATHASHTKTDLIRACAVLIECRAAWGRKMTPDDEAGEPVPLTLDAKNPGPFHRYVAKVFETLGIETTVRNAVDVNDNLRKTSLT